MLITRLASLILALTMTTSAMAAPYLGLFLEPPAGQSPTGTRIRFVVPESPAARAGFQRGDVIIKVQDQDVADAQSLVALIRAMNAGNEVVITIIRSDQEQQLTATLGEEQFVPPPRRPFFARRPMIGVGLEQVMPDGELRIGEVIPQSAAAEAGLKPGDVLQAIDGKQIEGYRMLLDHVRSKQVGDEVVLTIAREGEQVDHALKLTEFRPR